MRNFITTHKSQIFWFVFISAITHLDGNIAMLAGEGTAVYAIYLFLKMLNQLGCWLINRNSENLSRIKKTSIRFVTVAILCAVSWQGIQFIHWYIDRRFQPLIEKIKIYKLEHGDYPKNLDAILPTLSYVPKCGVFWGMIPAPNYYFYDPKNNRPYDITCMTYGFNHHTYNPITHNWSNGD